MERGGEGVGGHKYFVFCRQTQYVQEQRFFEMKEGTVKAAHQHSVGVLVL